MDVETKPVVYPCEMHGLAERAHQVDLLQRAIDWYDDHLKSK